MFCSEKLVEASFSIEFIHENELSSIHDHAVAGIAREDEDCLIRVIFDKAVEFREHFSKIFYLGFHVNLGVVTIEFKSVRNFQKVVTIIGYCLEIGVELLSRCLC